MATPTPTPLRAWSLPPKPKPASSGTPRWPSLSTDTPAPTLAVRQPRRRCDQRGERTADDRRPAITIHRGGDAHLARRAATEVRVVDLYRDATRPGFRRA